MGSQSAFQVAPFVADVTPRLGDTLVFGLDADSTVAVIEHPLLAKGVVLRDAGGTSVLCALDWCTLGNDAYALFRARIARAAGTSPSQVAVHTVQQHTAPGVDINAQRLLDREKDAPRCTNPDFLEAATERVAAAVHGAQWRSVTHVGTSWAAVDRVAASRRIRQPDGTILARYSRANDPAHRRAPEGYIDGFLRTISFCDGEAPLVQMHYYATHPQSYYGDRRVTYDVPGLARERLEKDSGVFQIHFSGCAGDITMGKYNAGTPEDRPEHAGTAFPWSLAGTPSRWQILRFPPFVLRAPFCPQSKCRRSDMAPRPHRGFLSSLASRRATAITPVWCRSG